MRQGLGGGTGKAGATGARRRHIRRARRLARHRPREGRGEQSWPDGLDSDYKETRPQIDFSVDYARAADLGVTVAEIGRTLQTVMGGRNVTTYLERGEEYDVIVEGERAQQRSFSDLNGIYVRSARSGQLIPLANLVTISEYGAAETLSRFNRVRDHARSQPARRLRALGEALTYPKSWCARTCPKK